MRIAYVTVHVAPQIMQGGVGKKIRTQITMWREQGHTVALFSLTPVEVPFPNEHQFIFDADANLPRREFNRMSALKRMLAAIREYRPDLIYLRFGLYSYPLHRLFWIAPVVLEINSNDIVEYATRGRFFYWMNRLTRNLIFTPASGIVTPTYELTSILPPYKKNGRVCVISNGYDLSNLSPLPPPQHTRPVMTLVGSPGMDWHGVDKLVDFAEINPDIHINIVGYSSADFALPVPGNVTLHGFVHSSRLREILMETDVACGTLALHRKNMNEACPLKVRESLAYGIPTIIAYKDTDLEGVSIETILRIPNAEDNVMVNAQRIRTFVYNMMGKRVDVNILAPYLDQRKKEEARLAFFEQILAEGK